MTNVPRSNELRINVYGHKHVDPFYRHNTVSANEPTISDKSQWFHAGNYRGNCVIYVCNSTVLMNKAME